MQTLVVSASSHLITKQLAFVRGFSYKEIPSRSLIQYLLYYIVYNIYSIGPVRDMEKNILSWRNNFEINEDSLH